MKIRVYRNNEVVFTEVNESGGISENGAGFLSADKSIGLTRCPGCLMENYAMNVLSGQCTWCGFNANTIDFE